MTLFACAADKTVEICGCQDTFYLSNYLHKNFHRSIYIPVRKGAKPKYDPTGTEYDISVILMNAYT